MSPNPTVSLPTKRTLGVGYVAGVGFVLAVSLLGFGLIAFDSTVLLAVTAGIALAICGTVGYLTYSVRDVELSEEFVWTVAQWTALGVAVGTLASFVVGFGHAYVPDSTLVSGVLVATIAAGGLTGTLLGVIAGLRTQRRRLADLSQRNTVLNRVLRHNIKNDMNVILGHTTLLEERVDGEGAHSVAAIERAARNVTRLSKSARQIDRLSGEDSKELVDVVETIETCIESTAGVYPGATFRTDVPERAWIEASPGLGAAVTNLLENAVEHNDEDPAVDVEVEAADGDEGKVLVRVADDGPGIVDHEREVLRADHEGPIRHGSGLGLWLVKWFVDQHDGELRFDANDPSGTVVELSLPAAESIPPQPAD